MKKILKAAMIGLAAAGMLLAGGCGSSEAPKSQAGSSSQSALMQKIKKDGKLVVGTASGFPPYEFLDTSVKDQQKIDGIDMKLAEAVAKKLGVKLEVQDMTFQSRSILRTFSRPFKPIILYSPLAFSYTWMYIYKK